ncbi:MAG: M28 family peptidase [Chitinophagaceae bacterium]
MLKKIALCSIALLAAKKSFLQDINSIINAQEVERIERVLSSDEMQGRRTFTPGIDKAADFIAKEFKKAGIKPLNGKSYFQEFAMIRTKQVSSSVIVNGQKVEDKNLLVFSAQPEVVINKSAPYEILPVKATDTLASLITRLQKTNKTYFLQIDTAQGRAFMNTKRRSGQFFYSAAVIVGVLTAEPVKEYEVNYKQEITTMPLKNVVGIIPGKSKKDEYVIFSGHYDHLGIGRPDAKGDSIFNGANDDAAGSTAVMMLAHYFAKQKNNERTLVFSTFTAEEVGGYGAQYFSRQFDPAKVIAMFNIEMIGTESKWGANSAYITGYEKSSMGEILGKNLEGTSFKFYPDPYIKEDLFYRSDNATLARLGVPAHTISTSKMDNEPNYHKQSDEIGTLDMNNMAEIIKAIAISSSSIISGVDTPSRVDASQLRQAR